MGRLVPDKIAHRSARVFAVALAMVLASTCSSPSSDEGSGDPDERTTEPGDRTTDPDDSTTDVDGRTTEPDDIEPDAPVSEAAPYDVEALGALAVAEGAPTTTVFDEGNSTLELTGGASLTVPADAFTEPTEVTVETFDLAFDSFLQPAPTGTLYVVSTADPVDLNTPVLLEVPRPTGDGNVVQHTDGRWNPIPTPDTDVTTLVVPIEHFSTVVTAVVDQLPDGTAAPTDVADGDNDAVFLQVCVLSVAAMFGGETDDAGQVELANNLALSLCTRALIARVSPAGQPVSVGCVGDKIGDDTDLRQAIALCIAERNADEPSDEDVAAPESGPEDASAAPTDGPLPPAMFVDGTYELELAPSGDQFFAIVRVTITGGSARIESESMSRQSTNFGDDVVCSFDSRQVLAGTDDDLTDQVISPSLVSYEVLGERSNLDGQCDHPTILSLLQTFDESTAEQRATPIENTSLTVTLTADGSAVMRTVGGEVTFMGMGTPGTVLAGG